VKVFAHNIRSLLMQPPLVGRRVLAIDPGFRTGCKVAALDEFGNLLDHGVIFPHGGGPGGKRKDPKKAQEQPVPASAAPTNEQQAPTPEAASAAPTRQTPTPTVEAPAITPELGDTTTPTPEMGPVVETSSQAPVPGHREADAPRAPERDPPANQEVDAPRAPEAALAAANQAAESTRAPELPAVDKRADAKAKLAELVQKYNLNIIALGN